MRISVVSQFELLYATDTRNKITIPLIFRASVAFNPKPKSIIFKMRHYSYFAKFLFKKKRFNLKLHERSEPDDKL
jgi:hypothetical protein